MAARGMWSRIGSLFGPLGTAGSIVGARTLPRRTRLDLLAIGVLRRFTGREVFSVRYPPGRVYLGRETLDNDLAQLYLVWTREPYSTSYVGAHAVDIGAHKGYYGAYALARGARSVRSYEPESRNFAALAKAADSFRACGADWTAERIAVASTEEVRDLVVSRHLSSAHSLLEVSRPLGELAELEAVPVASTEHVLREAAAGSSERLIVKVDAEGAECEILLGTAPDLWRSVDEVFVEVHGFAPCSGKEIGAHLARAGFVLERELAADPHAELHFVRS